MGNSSSSKTHDQTVDFGYLFPQGIYTGPRDWNQQIVGQLIVERRLAPFYKPLEDYQDDWTDEQILAARKIFNSGDGDYGSGERASSRPDTPPSLKPTKSRLGKESVRLNEAHAYRGAVECPICFMYYPPNINQSRCCFQPLCTECFVQIKRAEPTPTHLVSEPACCPYCQQDNFGVTYSPPSWRAGLGTETTAAGSRPALSHVSSGTSSDSSNCRRKSLGANSPEVVMIDQIRPDWEEKLAAVKAAVARRANRRIIMRQVGDRLIPVGVTSSRTQLPEGITTVEDIEELMLMEAMRLSLLDQQQQAQRSGNTATAPSDPPPSVIQQTPNSAENHAGNGVAPSGVANANNSQGTSAGESSRGRTTSGLLAGPLANATAVIGLATAHPSSPPASAIAPPPTSRGSTSNGSSSGFAGLRGRLTFGKNKDAEAAGHHRRSESNPPPITAGNALLGAHNTATAFLQAPDSSSAQQARSAPVTPRSAQIALPVDEGSLHSSTGIPSPVQEVPAEYAKESDANNNIPGGESSARSATVPPPAPIPLPEPVNHYPAT